MKRTLDKYKSFSPMKVKGKVILNRNENEDTKEEKEDSEEEDVFVVNTCHAKSEK